MKTGIDYLLEVRKRDTDIVSERPKAVERPSPKAKSKAAWAEPFIIFYSHGQEAVLKDVSLKGASLEEVSLEPFLIADLTLSTQMSGSTPSSRSLYTGSINRYLRRDAELSFVQEQHRKERDLLEVLIRQRNEQLERAEQEIISLTNRIHAIENQKRMDISYALASEDAKRILNILVKKITLNIDEVGKNITESDVLNVVCDLCKARLANLKGKKLIVTSLGLKVAKKLQSLND